MSLGYFIHSHTLVTYSIATVISHYIYRKESINSCTCQVLIIEIPDASNFDSLHLLGNSSYDYSVMVGSS